MNEKSAAEIALDAFAELFLNNQQNNYNNGQTKNSAPMA